MIRKRIGHRESGGRVKERNEQNFVLKLILEVFFS